jgi:hypothetical protein
LGYNFSKIYFDLEMYHSHKLDIRSPEILVSIAAFLMIVRSVIGTVDSFITVSYIIFFGFLVLVAKVLENKKISLVFGAKLLSYSIVVAAILSSILMLHPAHAQFLQQTQDALCGTFTASLGGASTAGATGIKNLVKIVVGFVRGIIIVIILGFAITIGVQRDDKEQVRELVKTPVLILVSTVVVDVLAFAVVGTAGGTC